jgi:hypothetical protein
MFLLSLVLLLQVEGEERPRYGRAALEEAAALAAGAIWYWLDDRNIADWDYPSLKERLNGEAWRFDNNTFPINYAWHAVNGTGFHAIARANGLSMRASFGYGFATSMVWEYVLEFREKVSINDVVVTPGAGLAMGEFVYWLGAYLGYPGLGHEVVDGRGPRRRDIGHRFELAYGFGGDVHELSARGELTPPGGRATSLTLRLPITAEGAGIDLYAEALLVRFVAIAYRYRYEELGDWEDRLSLMHLPGPAFDLRHRFLRVSARAHLDLVGVHAASYPAWEEAHPGAVEKTVLRRHGYYYGWGGSGRLAVELQAPYVGAGGALFYGRYASIEGLDRSQEEVTFDVEASDTVLDYEAWLRVSPWSRLYLQARLTHQSRDGRVGGVDSERDRRRYLVELGATL